MPSEMSAILFDLFALASIYIACGVAMLLSAGWWVALAVADQAYIARHGRIMPARRLGVVLAVAVLTWPKMLRV